MKLSITIIALCNLLFLSITGCSSGNIVERPFPKSEAPAIATAGTVIYSLGRIDEGTGNKKITYIKWKFQRADSSNIHFMYEEYFQNLKDKPDLSENKSLPLKQEIILGKCRLIIYRLTSGQMWYTLEFPQKDAKN